MPSTPDALLLRRTCASAFLRLSRSTIASMHGAAIAAGLSEAALAAPASVPAPRRLRASPAPISGKKGQLKLGFLPHGQCENSSYSSFQPFGPSPPASPATTMPSADFCAAISPPHGGLSPEFRTGRRSPEVRSTAFPAHPPNLPPRP